MIQREEEEIANKNLKNAKRNKNDEFYTQLTDIEKELKNYKDQLKNKVIFLNCDDPEWSNFWKYFKLNFDFLGIKKLISTHFEEDKPSYKLEYDGSNTVKTPLKQNGDFRSPESVELLKEADIVITNPPFSLFREYVAQLMKYHKKFLIMGNNNAITYKEIFALIKENKIWLGYHANKTMEFRLSDTYERWDRMDEFGNKYGKVPAITWFTNLDTVRRHEKIILYKKYTPEEYPMYDNYEAINVDRVDEIPVDYLEVMGVPITFMDKYNPGQFEIVALGNSRDNFTPTKTYVNPKKIMKDGKEVSGGAINCVLAISSKEKPKNKIYYMSDNSEYLLPPYARILIKRKDEYIDEN